MTAPVPTDAEVRDLAREILERREFRSLHDGPEAGEQLLVRVLEWLQKLVDALASLHETNPTLYWVVVATGVVILVILVVHLAWTIRLAVRAPEAEAPASSPRRDPVAEADALAAAGRIPEAAHLLMMASLARLAESRAIEIAPEDPNAVVRSRIRTSGLPADLREALVEAIAATETNWFRDRERRIEDYDRWRALFGRLGAAPAGA